MCVFAVNFARRYFSKKFFSTFWSRLQVVLNTSGWLFRH